MPSRNLPLFVVTILFVTSLALAESQPNADYSRMIDTGLQNPSVHNEMLEGPLPHSRPVDRMYVVPQGDHLWPQRFFLDTEDAPTSGEIFSPPEYAPAGGVLFRFSTGAWPLVVRDCVVALTASPTHDDIAYVVVSNTSQMSQAQGMFSAAGADMSKVVFIIAPNDSIWLRDYGPHFIFQNGAMGIVDSHYYPSRPEDNFIPTILADNVFLIPSYDIGLYYSGGNYQPSADKTGFATDIIYGDNPGFSAGFIGELFRTYQGNDAMVIFPALPPWVDGTGHIDMWFYLVDEDTVIISEFLPGSDATAISITNNAATYMADTLGYEVIRVPAHNGAGGVHYTYTNALRVNDRIFISSYGQGDPSHLARDAQALAAWQAAAGPGVEVIQIDSYDIIPAAGAIHCIVMQVPKRVAEIPAAHIISPDGGELIVEGNIIDLHWAATDNDDVTAIDLAYSTDGGFTFPNIIATGLENDGHYDWAVPDDLTTNAVIRVRARDDDGFMGEDFSEDVFEIASAPQHIYDFTSGAGTDKWAWGYQTTSWTMLDDVRRPGQVGTQLTAPQYDQLATKDGIRYLSPTPTSGWESTHIFEFVIDENPDTILDIGIHWEGFALACAQMELYVWDDVEGSWGDAIRQFGENRFMDNQAANLVNAVLEGHIRSEFDRYINPAGELTLLLYTERSGDPSVHDYVGLTVTYQDSLAGDFDGDGDVDLVDFADFQLCFTGPDGGPLTGNCFVFDFDDDDDVDLSDFNAFQLAFTGSL